MKTWQKVQEAASAVHLAYYSEYAPGKLDPKRSECGLRSGGLRTGEVAGWGDVKGREVTCRACLRTACQRFPGSYLAARCELLLAKLGET